MQRFPVIAAICMAVTFTCAGQERVGARRGEIVEAIPTGTRISVRTDTGIDVRYFANRHKAYDEPLPWDHSHPGSGREECY